MTPAQLRALMGEATPQPWMNNSHHECIHTHNDKVKLQPVLHYSTNNPRAEVDAEFIVAAINALPHLLAVCEAAEEVERTHQNPVPGPASFVDRRAALMELRSALAALGVGE